MYKTNLCTYHIIIIYSSCHLYIKKIYKPPHWYGSYTLWLLEVILADWTCDFIFYSSFHLRLAVSTGNFELTLVEARPGP